ncbi:hypothetical protein TWF569_004063 [Orbilia oligospora]|uniref:Uncharacterized protein n=1 Tax=Orbilia oligospora TaxID=2813651 RepID=A0A7C8K2F6_ORBOL|nr:hypothetical protein TWF706_001650 [Orbilia oligospora]KAF3100708.1 hypothetical protein TWF102_005089 [Orbilia oligospora]KAF3103945.1 hypothetical protein TWF103_007095 [Orbilia oligospora]KAF3141006.1 hypothetical protein TWF703_002513 [Orbilia oligospora]KAF3157161.1 hypothetical protein TWF569_004063 [Orbilia oligospora]
MEKTILLTKVYKNSRLAVFLACALKLAVTVPTWAQKARKKSFFEFLALVDSMLTDWMLFIVITYVLLHYLNKYGSNKRKKGGRYSSTSSKISRSSGGSDRSICSGSSITIRSNASYMSLGSITTSVIDYHNDVSFSMEQFLKGRDEYFLTAKGMVEGSFGEIDGSRIWDSGVEYGRREALLELVLE